VWIRGMFFGGRNLEYRLSCMQGLGGYNAFLNPHQPTGSNVGQTFYIKISYCPRFGYLSRLGCIIHDYPDRYVRMNACTEVGVGGRESGVCHSHM
jgi:hypothetical protein